MHSAAVEWTKDDGQRGIRSIVDFVGVQDVRLS